MAMQQLASRVRRLNALSVHLSTSAGKYMVCKLATLLVLFD